MTEDEHLEAEYEDRYAGEDYNVWEEQQVFLDQEADRMESIGSGEVFPNVELSVDDPPKHTEEGHLTCTYYYNDLQEEMECPHGATGAGGFYSEDYVIELKRNVHILIAFLDRVAAGAKRNYQQTHVNHYWPNANWDKMGNAVEELRELTK